jgi:hypothetical protein
VPQQAAEERILKLNIAIAALFTSAAFLTPANATSVLFTASTVLPATGTHGSPLTINLNDNAGSMAAYGYDGVFSVTAPPASVNINSATSESLDVSSNGLGLASNDTPYIGPTDAVLLDFANVKTTATNAGQTGSISQITFTLDITGTGSSDWVVYGMSNANGTGTGTIIKDGPMSPLGTFTVSTSTLYASYLIGVTQDCSLAISDVDVQYSGTTTTSTPEPGTFVMAGIALIGLGVTMKRRSRKA